MFDNISNPEIQKRAAHHRQLTPKFKTEKVLTFIIKSLFN